jgi:hypothetical protein
MVSVLSFGLLIFVAYFTLRFVSGRRELALCAPTLIATNWPLRHYGVVEVSQSFWQTMLCLFALILVFVAFELQRPSFLGRRRSTQHFILLFLSGSVWSAALFIKQQAVVVLPAIAVLCLVSQRSQRPIRTSLHALAAWASGAGISLVLLYWLLLGRTPIDEAYRYIILSNMARGVAIVRSHDWWHLKIGNLVTVVSGSLRIPVVMVFAGCLITIAWLCYETARGFQPTVGTHPRNQFDELLRRRVTVFSSALAIWAVTTIVFYLIHPFAHSHYLLEMALSLSLILPLALLLLPHRPVQVALANAMVLSLTLVWQGVLRDPVEQRIEQKGVVDRQIAALVDQNSRVDDKMLVFSNPVLYVLAERLPASRFPFFVDAWRNQPFLREYTNATNDGLTRETTAIVVVEQSVLERMPDEIRKLVGERLSTDYRVLAVKKNLDADPITIYIRANKRVSSREG